MRTVCHILMGRMFNVGTGYVRVKPASLDHCVVGLAVRSVVHPPPASAAAGRRAALRTSLSPRGACAALSAR